MTLRPHLLILMLLFLVTPLIAQEDEEEANEPSNGQKMVELARNVEDSFVRVEFTLRFDKGEAPRGWGHRGGGYGGNRYGNYVREERPLESAGFLLGPNRVAAPDHLIHPRFIEKVAVRVGDRVVSAQPVGYARLQNTIFLETVEPIQGAEPLEFDAEAEGPYYAVSHYVDDGKWKTRIAGFPSAVQMTETDPPHRRLRQYAIIIDAAGTPVGLSMGGALPVSGSWKGSPDSWKRVSEKAMDKRLAELEALTETGLLRVQLSFRSPRKGTNDPFGGMRYGSDDEQATEQNKIGLLYEKDRLLILANLKPKKTARLERIQVHIPGGEPVEATFTHTLEHYGAFLARLDTPLEGTIPFSDVDPRTVEDDIHVSAEVILRGEKRVTYFQRNRMTGFRLGWRRHLYPGFAYWSAGTWPFAWDGGLLAVPIARREKAGGQSRWSRSEALATSVRDLKEVLANPDEHADVNNIPLSEEEENRQSWLGLELQVMDQNLARVNRVAHLTNDGKSGAIVSYVYPDSPAQEAGLRSGDVLLRIHVEGRPKPVDLELRRWGAFGSRPFPWDRLDEVPPQYFDRIPKPWLSAAEGFRRILTEIGFGEKIRVEIFRDDEVVEVPFTLKKSPPHYDSAPRYKSEELGMTVRDLTYEVRRYFQKTPEDPGVIVSTIKPGEKAAVAGVKPFEIITEVNGTPVKSVEEFEAALEGADELRLAIQRKIKNRIVKIKLEENNSEE